MRSSHEMRLQKSATTGHNCIKFLEKQEPSTNTPTHDTPYLPQKCFISIVFSILRDDSNTHKKNRSNGCAKCFFFVGGGGGGGEGGLFSQAQGVKCLPFSRGSYVWV